jgi:hypothetical protein
MGDAWVWTTVQAIIELMLVDSTLRADKTRPCSLARRANVSAGDPDSALWTMVSVLIFSAGILAILFYMLIAH